MVKQPRMSGAYLCQMGKMTHMSAGLLSSLSEDTQAGEKWEVDVSRSALHNPRSSKQEDHMGCSHQPLSRRDSQMTSQDGQGGDLDPVH
jgi:hypothetical protein